MDADASEAIPSSFSSTWGFPLPDGSGPSLKGTLFGFTVTKEHAPDCPLLPSGIYSNWMQADGLIL